MKFQRYRVGTKVPLHIYDSLETDNYGEVAVCHDRETAEKIVHKLNNYTDADEALKAILRIYNDTSSQEHFYNTLTSIGRILETHFGNYKLVKPLTPSTTTTSVETVNFVPAVWFTGEDRNNIKGTWELALHMSKFAPPSYTLRLTCPQCGRLWILPEYTSNDTDPVLPDIKTCICSYSCKIRLYKYCKGNPAPLY